MVQDSDWAFRMRADGTEQALINESRRQYETQTVHDPDFEVFRLLIDSGGLFLDLGGNRGQSAISYRLVQPAASIISFEANPRFENVLQYLKVNLLAQFDYQILALGDHRGTLDLNVPVVDGNPYLEEASVDMAYFELPWVSARLRACGRDLCFVRIPVEAGVIDDFNFSPRVVKVDVEGHELAVLRGMENTLRRCNPVLLVENSDWHHVTSFLCGMGYQYYAYDSKAHAVIPLVGATTNTLYISNTVWPFRGPKP